MSRWQPMAEELVRTRQRALIAYAYLLTRDAAAAEDLVQDALVRTFTGRAHFESIHSAEGYVRRAIASAFLDGRRRVVRRTRRESAVALMEAQQSHAALVEADADLALAMSQLAPRERACVALRYLADMSVAQTAEALDLSQGAVKRYTHDGAAALARLLGATVDDADTVAIDVKGGRS